MTQTLASTLLGRLHSDDADVRYQTLLAISGDELELLHAHDLLPLLADEDRLIRQLTLHALAELNDVAAIPAILDTITDRDPRVVAAARSALGEFRTRDAVDPLTAGVAHRAAEVRAAAVASLREFRSPRALPALRAAIEDSSSVVRREAVLTLARLPDNNVLSLLRWSLYDSDAEVRRAAVQAVGSLGDAETLGLIIRALSDREWEVRRQAALVLAHFPGVPAAVLGLRRALQDEHPQVVREVIRSLGKLHAPVARQLTPFLDHELPELRVAAAKALGEIGEGASRFQLSALLDDRDKSVARAALHAIAHLDALESEAA